MLTILHISDLHRDDPQRTISNTVLLNSLTKDFDRYTQSEQVKISSPNLIIVSGDIVQGARGSTDTTKELNRQYDEAESFLSKLADDFLAGDRTRLILVPGNHDVSDHLFKQSLEELKISSESEGHKIKEAVNLYFDPNSTYRWSWNLLKFFRIKDRGLYDLRMKPFCEFYNRFYEGRRSWDLDSTKQFDIFDYPEFNVVVTAFSSCNNNDTLNVQGAIHPECIARASKKLDGWNYQNRLRLAVWHHNTNGSPVQTDYMDFDTLQNLIDNGFSIGFHGHQHKPQFIDEKFQFGAERKITVISAGSLCAGPKALPTGRPRSYNLLEIDVEDFTAKLHLREMKNEKFEDPIWSHGLIPVSQKSFLEFSIQPPPKATMQDNSINQKLLEADKFIQENKYSSAIEVLTSISNNPIARKLIIECYIATEDSTSIIDVCQPPQSISEFIYLADALWNEQKLDSLRILLSGDEFTQSSDPSIKSVLNKYLLRIV
jgi:predicted phosphodiesterase